MAAHHRLHSVRHKAARCARHRAQLMRTVAATCVRCRRHATPCATIAQGGRPTGTTPTGQRAAAACSYSAHRSTRCAQLQFAGATRCAHDVRTLRATALAHLCQSSDTTVGAAADLDPVSRGAAEVLKFCTGNGQYIIIFTGKLELQRLAAVVIRIRSTIGNTTPQSALEELTNLPRTESPRRGGWNESNHEGGGTRRRRVRAAAERGGGGGGGRAGGGVEREVFRRWGGDTASRGPTTIVTTKSQFRTDPSDHGKAPSNIVP
ncbi:L-ascorbate oxidase-like [Dorcoceras hygrometricum]|uniref:L-ascorbate oxidase-like n=1 Tax=Dorcoceras hygrometricum TaxID=472368 RepID=A0A2Z7BRA2_9LAMI|nr:L-ascorbate oxidase-like [Dorcoceras hygrometricum]